MNDLSQVRLNRLAVGDSDSTGFLSLADQANTGTGSLQPSVREAAQAFAVQITTLDHYFSGLNMGPQVVKIDIEGAELLALRGAENLIRVFRPVLLVESSEDRLRAFGHSAAELTDYLTGFGYKLYSLNRDTLRPLSALSVGVYDNLICYPNDSQH